MSTARYERLRSRGVHSAYGVLAIAAGVSLLGFNYKYVEQQKASGGGFDFHDHDLEIWLSPAFMGAGFLFIAAGWSLMRHAFSPNGCRVS